MLYLTEINVISIQNKKKYTSNKSLPGDSHYIRRSLCRYRRSHPRVTILACVSHYTLTSCIHFIQRRCPRCCLSVYSSSDVCRQVSVQPVHNELHLLRSLLLQQPRGRAVQVLRLNATSGGLVNTIQRERT